MSIMSKLNPRTPLAHTTAPSERTRHDMTDIENVKDAGWELDRAGDDAAKLAVWAAKWGRALIVHARGW